MHIDTFTPFSQVPFSFSLVSAKIKKEFNTTVTKEHKSMNTYI